MKSDRVMMMMTPETCLVHTALLWLLFSAVRQVYELLDKIPTSEESLRCLALRHIPGFAC